MNIPKKAKCLEEYEKYLVLKTGNQKYCVYNKVEDRVVFEASSASKCYDFCESEEDENNG